MTRSWATRIESSNNSSDVERWDLRVTELFRYDGETWKRFYRYTDPLIDTHTVDELRRLLG
jgi:hypothetical protein